MIKDAIDNDNKTKKTLYHTAILDISAIARTIAIKISEICINDILSAAEKSTLPHFTVHVNIIEKKTRAKEIEQYILDVRFSLKKMLRTNNTKEMAITERHPICLNFVFILKIFYSRHDAINPPPETAILTPQPISPATFPIKHALIQETHIEAIAHPHPLGSSVPQETRNISSLVKVVIIQKLRSSLLSCWLFGSAIKVSKQLKISL